MDRSVEELESEVLNLPPHLRARLAEMLIASLDEDAEIERAWVAEVEKRAHELDSGKVAGIPDSEVFERARNRF